MTPAEEIEILQLKRKRAMAMAQQEAPPDEAGSPLFPTASKIEGSGIVPSVKRVGTGLLDALNIPTRALATVSGQKMSDPNSYLLRPAVDAMKADTTGEREKESQILANKGDQGYPDFSWQTMPSAVNANLENAGRIASDPIGIFSFLKQLAAPITKSAGEQIFSGAVKIPKALKKSEGISPVDILESGYGGSIRPNYEKTVSDLHDLSAQKRNLLEEHGRKVTLTSHSPDITVTPPSRKTGFDAQYQVHQMPPDIIYGQPPAGAALGTPQITDGRIPMGAPKGARPPDVAVTPPGEMPNQIDPRYARPFATSTKNQTPIPDAPQGAAYGIPSDRNLPALFQEAAPPMAQQFPEIEAVKNALAHRSNGDLIPGRPPSFIGDGPEIIPGRKSVKDVTRVVDIRGRLQAIKNRLAQEILDYGHSGKTEDIASGIREWESELNNAKAGPASLLEAHDFAQGVGEMGYWRKGQNPKEIPAKAHVAEEFYDALRNAIVDKAPETAALNQKMTDIIPINKALKETLMRTENNHPISLTDVTMGAGLPALLASGHLKEATALAGGLAVKKAAQSPMIGNALYQTGKSLSDTDPIREAITRALLSRDIIPQDSE